MNEINEIVGIYSTYNNIVELSTRVFNDKSNPSIENAKAYRDNLDVQKSQLENLLTALNKYKNVFSLDTLSVQVGEMLDLLADHIDVTNEMIEAYETSKDADRLRELIEIYNGQASKYKDCVSNLDNTMSESLENFKEYLYDSFNAGIIDGEMLYDLGNNMSLSNEQKAAVTTIIDKISEERKLAGQTVRIITEQTSVEDKKGNLSNSANLMNGDSLMEYNAEKVYFDEVQKGRIQNELKLVNDQIQPLNYMKEVDGRLSFRNAVQLQALLTQKAELENMLENPKSIGLLNTIREWRMGDVDASLTRSTEKLEKAKKSRFFSEWRQEKLNEKIDKLNTKMGVLKSQQTSAALTSFVKSNNSIARSARFHAPGQVIAERSEPIKTAVKEAGQKAVQGVQSLVDRFKSKGNDTSELEYKKGAMTVTPEPINIPNELSSSHVY